MEQQVAKEVNDFVLSVVLGRKETRKLFKTIVLANLTSYAIVRWWKNQEVSNGQAS